jgi:hypothetical protein
VAGAGKILVTGHIGNMPPTFSTQHSEQNSIESGNNLQPRSSMPDIPIRNDIPKNAPVLTERVIGHVAEKKEPDPWKPDDF